MAKAVLVKGNTKLAKLNTQVLSANKKTSVSLHNSLITIIKGTNQIGHFINRSS